MLPALYKRLNSAPSGKVKILWICVTWRDMGVSIELPSGFNNGLGIYLKTDSERARCCASEHIMDVGVSLDFKTWNYRVRHRFFHLDLATKKEIISRLAYFWPILKISSKLVHNFSSYAVYKHKSGIFFTFDLACDLDPKVKVTQNVYDSKLCYFLPILKMSS